MGTPVGGVEVKIAEDGEILVRGENVTEGYYEPADGNRQTQTPPGDGIADSRTDSVRSRLRDAEGWLHTGDIGELDAQGRLFIRGRKKEMIVTPEGLNVYPDDVERELEGVAGVVESAVVGHREAGAPRSASTRCWCSSRTSIRTRWSPRPTRGWRTISACAVCRCGPPDRCRAPRARKS